MRVYKYVSGLYVSDWVKIGDDIDGEAANDEFGYSLSLSKNASTLVVGAPINSGSRGRAYTYKLIEQPSIKSIVKMGEPINGEASQDLFAHVCSCNADGTVIAMGAYKNSDNGTHSGHVRVYKYFDPSDAVDNYNDHKYFGVIPTSTTTNGQWAFYSFKIIQSGVDIVYIDPNNTTQLTIGGYESGSWGWQIGRNLYVNTYPPLWYVETNATIDGTPLTFELRTHTNELTPYTGIYVSASSPSGPWIIRNSWNIDYAPYNAWPNWVGLSNTPGIKLTSDLSKKWLQLGDDLDGEDQVDYNGHSVSLNADGTIVTIGALFNDGINGPNSGHVRIYKWNGSIWDQLGDDIDGEAKDDYSGRSVSSNADGTIIAIGANGNDGNGPSSGHVRVYDYVKDRSPKEWKQMGSDIDGEGQSSSGYSVSLSADGTILAIGAPYNDSNSKTNNGRVHFRKWNGNEWMSYCNNIDGIDDDDYSGYSVSLNSDGTIVAIGAYGTTGKKGYVHMYNYDENRDPQWKQLGSTIYGEVVDDWFGWSLSLSGDGTILAVGGPHNDNAANNAGHVRVYQYIEDKDWVQIGYTIDGEAEADNEFGYSVSLSKNGSVLLIGAPYRDGNGTNSGRAYTYEIV